MPTVLLLALPPPTPGEATLRPGRCPPPLGVPLPLGDALPVRILTTGSSDRADGDPLGEDACLLPLPALEAVDRLPGEAALTVGDLRGVLGPALAGVLDFTLSAKAARAAFR